MVNLTSLINLDFISVIFFVSLYSFLEILIKKAMDDFRSIEIQQHFQEEEEDEEDDGLIRERIIFPVNLNQSHRLEMIEDYDDDDEDDDVLIPVPIEDFEDDDDFGFEDDFDFDDDFDDDDDDDYEDEDEEEEEEMTSPPRVSNSVAANSLNDIADGRRIKEETSSSSCCSNGGDQIDGLNCPICFEPWTSSGIHQICCLPCGHLYGLSCIRKWLYQRRSSGKCPQCNSLCTFKDVRVLYVNQLCVADIELQKRVRLLEAKCDYLEEKSNQYVYTHADVERMMSQIESRMMAAMRSHTAPLFKALNMQFPDDEDGEREVGEEQGEDEDQGVPINA